MWLCFVGGACLCEGGVCVDVQACLIVIFSTDANRENMIRPTFEASLYSLFQHEDTLRKHGPQWIRGKSCMQCQTCFAVLWRASVDDDVASVFTLPVIAHRDAAFQCDITQEPPEQLFSNVFYNITCFLHVRHCLCTVTLHIRVAGAIIFGCVTHSGHDLNSLRTLAGVTSTRNDVDNLLARREALRANLPCPSRLVSLLQKTMIFAGS